MLSFHKILVFSTTILLFAIVSHVSSNPMPSSPPATQNHLHKIANFCKDVVMDSVKIILNFGGFGPKGNGGGKHCGPCAMNNNSKQQIGGAGNGSSGKSGGFVRIAVESSSSSSESSESGSSEEQNASSASSPSASPAKASSSSPAAASSSSPASTALSSSVMASTAVASPSMAPSSLAPSSSPSPSTSVPSTSTANPSGSVSLSIKTVNTWRDSTQSYARMSLVFTNKGSTPICSIQFQMVLPSGETFNSKWNIVDSSSANQYSLPSWLNIAPGATYENSGFIVAGGTSAPIGKILSVGGC